MLMTNNVLNTQIIRITPTMASDLLSRNKNNRKIAKGVVSAYAKDISEGNWALNGESIKVDAQGNLVDGQHRLLAIVEADRAVESMVVTGIPSNVMATVDVGKKRTASDLFSLKGFSYPRELASTLAVLVNLKENASLARSRVTPLDQQNYLEINPDVETSVHFTVANKNAMRWRPQYAASHYLFSMKDGNAADNFIVRLCTGLGVTEDDAVYRLREKLIKEESERKKHNRDDVMFWFIRSWNAEREGKSIGKLHGAGKSDSFPEII